MYNKKTLDLYSKSVVYLSMEMGILQPFSKQNSKGYR